MDISNVIKADYSKPYVDNGVKQYDFAYYHPEVDEPIGYGAGIECFASGQSEGPLEDLEPHEYYVSANGGTNDIQQDWEEICSIIAEA